MLLAQSAETDSGLKCWNRDLYDVRGWRLQAPPGDNSQRLHAPLTLIGMFQQTKTNVFCHVSKAQIQKYKCTNTAYQKVPERPNMWYIFEKRIVQGYLKLYTGPSVFCFEILYLDWVVFILSDLV